MPSLRGNRGRCLPAAFLISVGAILPASVIAQPQYKLTIIGTLGGPQSAAWAVNDSGQVAGYAKNGSGNDRPFLWDPNGGLKDLGTLGGPIGQARGINADGTIVGYAQDGAGLDRPFKWTTGGGLKDLGVAPGAKAYVWGISDSGYIAGSLFNVLNNERAFRLDKNNVISDIGTLGGPQSRARAVNNVGAVVGWAEKSANDARAFSWTANDGIKELAASAEAGAIDSSGGVAGVWFQKSSAFAAKPGDKAEALNEMLGIKHTLKMIQGWGSNDAGQIVGYGTNQAGNHRAYVWDPRFGDLELTSLIPPGSGWILEEARDISNTGFIVGFAKNAQGQMRAFRLDPPPFGPRVFVNAAANPGGDGLSWATAYRDVQDGITAAVLSMGTVKEIWVAKGTYVPSLETKESFPLTATFRMMPDVRWYGGFAGTESSLDERDIAANPTNLSGDRLGNDIPEFGNRADNCNNVVIAEQRTTEPSQTSARMDGFTVRAGNSTTIGGGLLAEVASPVIANCTFSDNAAFGSGGGAKAKGGSAIFLDCRFEGNRTYDGHGGGLSAEFQASVVGCAFVGNSAISAGPAGLEVTGTILVLNCEIRGNTSVVNVGGATCETGSVFVNCVIAENNGTGLSLTGRAINCLINGNHATAAAGVSLAAPGSLVNCTIVQNIAESFFTGGVRIEPGTPTIDNCILWGNADASGAGQDGQIGGFAAQVNFSTVQGWTGSLGGIQNDGFDPAFVDMDGADGVPGTADDDLRLQSPVSSCIDSGASSRLPPDEFDLDGDRDTTEILPIDGAWADRRIDDPAKADSGEGPAPIVDRGWLEFAPAPCYPDCDASGELDIDDFICFQTLFGLGDVGADCDASGELDIDDFICFQTSFGIGCG